MSKHQIENSKTKKLARLCKAALMNNFQFKELFILIGNPEIHLGNL